MEPLATPQIPKDGQNTEVLHKFVAEDTPSPPKQCVIPNETSPVLNMMEVPDDDQEINIKVSKRPENLDALMER